MSSANHHHKLIFLGARICKHSFFFLDIIIITAYIGVDGRLLWSLETPHIQTYVVKVRVGKYSNDVLTDALVERV